MMFNWRVCVLQAFKSRICISDLKGKRWYQLGKGLIGASQSILVEGTHLQWEYSSGWSGMNPILERKKKHALWAVVYS